MNSLAEDADLANFDEKSVVGVGSKNREGNEEPAVGLVSFMLRRQKRET